MPFNYKNPITPEQLKGAQSVSRSSTQGTNFSILGIGGYVEVYNLTDLIYTIPSGTTGPIQFSGNSLPITFTKGTGSSFSLDVLTLNSDNISSGRRRLGMLAYVKELDQVYQFDISNFETLWNAATGATGIGGSTVVFSDFGTTVSNNSVAGQNFINAWTGTSIEGYLGVTRSTSNWKKFWANNLAITGGTYNGSNNTVTLINITGGSQSFIINTVSGLTINGNLSVTGTTTSSTYSGNTFLSTGTYGSVTMNAGNNLGMLAFSGSNTVGGTGYTDFIRVTNTAAGATNINKTIRVNITGSIEFLNSAYNALTFSIADNGILTINSPASVTSNSAIDNALNIGTKGQLFDDGNFHIHSSSGAVWINSLDGSAIRLGTQTNSGNSPVIVDTSTVGHSFFTKVQSAFNAAFGTEITMDNLKVRINGTGGSGGLVQAGAVSGSFAAYTTLLGNVAGSALQGDTNSGGITFTTTYQNISGSQKTLSAGGDVTELHLIDTTNSRIYRITAIHCQGTTGGYTSIERMS